MSRFLVVFCSGTEPRDATVVDVVARHALEAIAEARRHQAPEHPWATVTAKPWPRGWVDVDDAARRLAP